MEAMVSGLLEAMAMEDMVDTVLDTAVDTMADTVDTMASVRLRLSPRLRLMLIPTSMEDMDMEAMVSGLMEAMAMEDMVDTVLDTAVDTMADTVGTMASVRLML